MRALTVTPGEGGSARIDDVDEPPPDDGPVLVEAIAVGVCGTDREIVDGAHGAPPPDRDRLILGHESLGRVQEAPEGSGLSRGDLVVGVVRHADPVPCPACAAGEPDMCRNGRYTERGIQGRDGFAAERFRLEVEHAVRVDPRLADVGMLVEPASVLAKAWEHVEAIGRRAHWEPRRALITGAGPIGLLAALMAAQRGLEVHVLDRNTDGPKPALVRALGATYHTSSPEEACREADVVIECTGAGPVVLGAMRAVAPGGVVALTGLSGSQRATEVQLAALNRDLVLENAVVFGTVNAARRHYQAGMVALLAADPSWTRRLISRRAPLDRWQEALEKRPGDVKVVVEVAS